MAASRLRAFCADRPPTDQSKYYTRVPDDALEDPRLTDAQFKVFVNLLKNNWTGSRVIEVTQAELAARARVTERCVRDAMNRLRDCGYIRMGRDWSRRGGPFTIELCYELRPSLSLEEQPPVTTGSKASDRKRRSGPDRKLDSSPDRKRRSGPFLLFETERNTERTTTAAAVESSSSFSAALEGEDPPKPPAPADLVDLVKRLWPDEALVDRRLSEILERGEDEGRLALEYAELMGAKGLVYAVKTRDRWHRDGYDLDDCRAEVKAQRPRAPAPTPVVTHRQQGPELPPTAEEIQATIEAFAASTLPTVRRLYEGRLNGWITEGLITADMIPGAQKDGRGCSRQLPPRPSGVHPSEPQRLPESDHTVKVCSRQGVTLIPPSGQRARKDSNLQPSDSKYAGPTPVKAPESSAILDPPAPSDSPDTRKTRGGDIRRFEPG